MMKKFKIRLNWDGVQIFLYAEFGFIMGNLVFGVLLEAVFGFYCFSASPVYYMTLLILASVCISLFSFGFQAIERPSSRFNSVLMASGHFIYFLLNIYYYVCQSFGLVCSENWPGNEVFLIFKFIPHFLISITGFALNLTLLKSQSAKT